MSQLVGSIGPMSDASRSSRTVTALSDGARWAILAGIPFLALAAYFFFTPISLMQGDGGYFYCGSAASPNTESASVCSPFEKSHRIKAMASLGAGLGVPLAGLGLFGVTRRQQVEDLDEDGGRPDDRRRGATLLDDDETPERRDRRGGRGMGRDGRTRSVDDLDDLDDDETLADATEREPRARTRGRASDDWDDESR